MNPDQQTPPRAPRRNLIAERKAQLRAELASLANKVPAKVNAGSVQTTQGWLRENEALQLIARGGRARLSRHQLQALLDRMAGWHEEEP